MVIRREFLTLRSVYSQPPIDLIIVVWVYIFNFWFYFFFLTFMCQS